MSPQAAWPGDTACGSEFLQGLGRFLFPQSKESNQPFTQLDRMAVQMMARRRTSNATTNYTMSYRRGDEDKENEILMSRLNRRFGELENLEIQESSTIADGPVQISSAALIGCMPKVDKILKRGIVGKLVSSYDWRPMNIALTSDALFFSRPGEDVLRDLIPLSEVVDVKKRHDIPGEHSSKSESSSSLSVRHTNSIRPLRMSALVDDNKKLFILQLRTKEDGYNSGRSYYLQTESEDVCNEWSHILRAEAS